jgi:hypothetical protein
MPEMAQPSGEDEILQFSAVEAAELLMFDFIEETVPMAHARGRHNDRKPSRTLVSSKRKVIA